MSELHDPRASFRRACRIRPCNPICEQAYIIQYGGTPASVSLRLLARPSDVPETVYDCLRVGGTEAFSPSVNRAEPNAR
jgi:hypothetical protein